MKFNSNHHYLLSLTKLKNMNNLHIKIADLRGEFGREYILKSCKIDSIHITETIRIWTCPILKVYTQKYVRTWELKDLFWCLERLNSQMPISFKYIPINTNKFNSFLTNELLHWKIKAKNNWIIFYSQWKKSLTRN